METKIDRRKRVEKAASRSPVKCLGGLVCYDQEGVGLVVSAAEHNRVYSDLLGKVEEFKVECMRWHSRAKAYEEDFMEMLKRCSVLIEAGDRMELLLTGSAKPSKGVREAWEAAKGGKAGDELRYLRADRARLDWLADKTNGVGGVFLPHECVEANLTSMRGAIDQAMAGNFKKEDRS
jgi:hypothetical protein